MCIRTFTTQPDTVYGVSFVAISLDHELLAKATLNSSVVQQLGELRNQARLSSKRKAGKKG